MKTLIIGFLLCFAGSAHAQTQDELLNGLFAKCDQSFLAYTVELEKVRSLLKSKFSAMKQGRIDQLSVKNDIGLNMMRLNFPDDLKDETIDVYRYCADRNAFAREVLASKNSSVRDRKEIVQEVHDCISHIYTAGKRVIAPFDKMLSCYQKQIGK